jgi:MFS family permease
LLCVAAALGVLSDGYQIQMSGSIVALKGFIETFGDPNEDGKYVINPQYLALWGCESSTSLVVSICSKLIDDSLATALKNVAAMFGAALGSYPADRFGRRWMMLLVQIIMIGGCVLEQLATDWTHWLGARLLDVSFCVLSECSRCSRLTK